jgi:hypothetical protein
MTIKPLLLSLIIQFKPCTMPKSWSFAHPPHSQGLLPWQYLPTWSTIEKNKRILWMWKSAPNAHERIYIKRFNHASTCIWFSGQLEHKLLNVKESHWQHFKHPYFLGWGNAILITSKCLLLKLYFTSNARCSTSNARCSTSVFKFLTQHMIIKSCLTHNKTL